MPDSPTVREAAEAWEALFRCQVGMMRRLQKLAEFKELNMREYDVLFNLGRCPSGSSRLSDLNEHLLISQPSLSRMAERLGGQGPGGAPIPTRATSARCWSRSPRPAGSCSAGSAASTCATSTNCSPRRWTAPKWRSSGS